ncbi:hypothetical protein M8C21_028080 [Ambrosia artemisiifolia]|uniref:UDP-glycosyltransferases domain-containing protein n=1 Tax=Ambrosia artemisiifolia TaxID=4212 RepID=A0AAD5D6L6_AMBAR|nr:hypothetical protein M8C21_028080 [Ambrosia artemisiifolia]
MADQHAINKSPHVILLSFLAQGHINPVIQFGKRLVSKGVKTTLVTTIYVLKSSLPHKNNITSIRIEAIYDGFDEVGSKSLVDLIKKLRSEGNIWALAAAMEFGIHGGPIVSVPGLPQFEGGETPSFVYNFGAYPVWSDMVFNQFANIDQAHWVFTNTFYHLEEQVIDWMKKMWNLKVTGPTIPSMYLDKRLEDDKDYGLSLFDTNHNKCMNWLNDKQTRSVVYVSFGSVAQLELGQMKEISWALIDIDVNFLWVVRDEEKEKLPKDLIDERIKGKGLVVSWCKQLDVLKHESVGCFVTHCGFNSTLEALCLGVPVIGMPQWTDQTPNAKSGNLVSCIKRFMHDDVGVVARKNAKKWMELAKLAVDKGGSSDKDIDEFDNTMKQPRPDYTNHNQTKCHVSELSLHKSVDGVPLLPKDISPTHKNLTEGETGERERDARQGQRLESLPATFIAKATVGLIASVFVFKPLTIFTRLMAAAVGAYVPAAFCLDGGNFGTGCGCWYRYHHMTVTTAEDGRHGRRRTLATNSYSKSCAIISDGSLTERAVVGCFFRLTLHFSLSSILCDCCSCFVLYRRRVQTTGISTLTYIYVALGRRQERERGDLVKIKATQQTAANLQISQSFTSTMAEQHKMNKPPHVLLFPFPAQGHINPIIQFGKRLLSKGVKITLVTTIYILKTNLPHEENTTPITIEAISDGFDEGGYASADSSESYLKTFKEVGSKSLGDLIKKLQSQGGTIDAIIYDAFISWALDVAMEFGIDGGSFFTQACSVNNIYYHVHKGLISLPLCVPVSVPGLPQLECWETPSFVHNYGPYPGWSEIVFNQFCNIDQARWVFTNSFYKLEEEVIEWMRKMWNLKVIGPTLPSMYLDKRIHDDKDYGFNLFKENHNECKNWLYDKPKKSVVYVSFGSSARLGPKQMEEIAWGLSESNVNFLWVVRAEEAEKLPNEFVNQNNLTEKGLVVAWCRQLDVLAHESIGCFVTHCGFNSTLEAISLGVPVVGMPQWTDQTTNAKLLDEIWGVGVRVKANENGIVTRGNLVSCIKKIMEDEKGAIAQKNAMKWREAAKEAVDEGGSSYRDIDEFINELKHEF